MTDWVVITDLDGTLLDAVTYSWADAAAALDELRRRKIPVVFCTSKTRDEVEWLQEKLAIHDPFVVENGSAIVWPDRVEVLGQPREWTLRQFREIRAETGAAFRGISEMTNGELSQLTGLDLDAVERARHREYDEPFEVHAFESSKLSEFVRNARTRGLQVSRSRRFAYLHGPTDKGAATRRILDRFSRIRSLGLGDGLLDLPMLRTVDIPVVVAGPGGTHDRALVDSLAPIWCTRRVGPAGWQDAIEGLVLCCGNLETLCTRKRSSR